MRNKVQTENKIKVAAKNAFIVKGKAGARMQEIANEAGINKAMLHYYFKSKDQLFHAVFTDVVRDMIPKLFLIFKDDFPLEVKVYRAVEFYIDFLSEHPEIPLFILGELQSHPKDLLEHLDIEKSFDFKVINEQLIEEHKKGNIVQISAPQFMLNLISMMVFPFVAKPIFQKVMKLEDEQYQQLLQARKVEVPKFIMSALRP